MTVSPEIIAPALDYIKSLPKILLGDDCVINMYIKTPNIYYRTVRVYLKIANHDAYEVTEKLKDSLFNLVSVRDMMAIVYHDYFSRYNEPFKHPYYKITYSKVGNNWINPIVSGSPSPDPLDANGTVIKRNLS